MAISPLYPVGPTQITWPAAAEEIPKNKTCLDSVQAANQKTGLKNLNHKGISNAVRSEISNLSLV